MSVFVWKERINILSVCLFTLVFESHFKCSTFFLFLFFLCLLHHHHVLTTRRKVQKRDSVYCVTDGNKYWLRAVSIYRARQDLEERICYSPGFVFLLAKISSCVFLQSYNKVPPSFNLVFHCEGHSWEKRRERERKSWQRSARGFEWWVWVIFCVLLI